MKKVTDTACLTPLARVLRHIGDEIGTSRGAQAELARRIDQTPQYVSKIIKTGRVPLEQCRAIEAAVGGKVTAAQLRPDLSAIFNTPEKPEETKQAF